MHRDISASPEHVGEWFQEVTIYRRGQIPRHHRSLAVPDPFKTYPDARAVIPLDTDLPKGGDTLWTLLAQRRSRRDFSGDSISHHTLSALLWATQGVTARVGEYLLRTAPSAGALYPIETYLCLNGVENLAAGIYHLNVPAWSLEFIHEGDFTDQLSRAALDQPMVAQAAAIFIWTAIPGRTVSKYGQRGYRYLYLDAAHIAAHLYLAAEALNLGCCAIAALYDNEVNQIIEVSGSEETILYMAAVGPVSSHQIATDSESSI